MGKERRPFVVRRLSAAACHLCWPSRPSSSRPTSQPCARASSGTTTRTSRPTRRCGRSTGSGASGSSRARVPQYYPLTFTSLRLDHHLWGVQPLGYPIRTAARSHARGPAACGSTGITRWCGATAARRIGSSSRSTRRPGNPRRRPRPDGRAARSAHSWRPEPSSPAVPGPRGRLGEFPSIHWRNHQLRNSLRSAHSAQREPPVQSGRTRK